MNRLLNETMQRDVALVDQTMQSLLPSDEDYSVLFDAMHYSLQAGGKRVRPFLTLAFCRLFGGEQKYALPYACAIEMVHTYSLIHDDLPCMDDDALRRGKPTNHIVYGEGTAMLAGDGLLTQAFKTICNAGGPYDLQAVGLLADSAGVYGMIGGQQMDLIGEKTSYSLEKLLKTYELKTGKLIACACLLGVLAAGYQAQSIEYKKAALYAACIGTAFQITDDILDCYGDEEKIGKPVGSDAAQGKRTFLALMSRQEAYDYAKDLTARAKQALSGFEGNEILMDFADYLLNRVQ